MSGEIAAVPENTSCYLKREGASHSLWCNPRTGHCAAVSRHTEVSNRLADRIVSNLGLPRLGGPAA